MFDLLPGFKVSVTPIMDGIIMLHNYVMFYLIVIFVFVFFLLIRLYYSFNRVILKPRRVQHVFWRYLVFLNKNFTHGTTLELVWTTVPGLVLLSLAFPSFALLYTMDEVLDSQFFLKVTGHQWYWSYNWESGIRTLMSASLKEESLEYDSYMLPESEIADEAGGGGLRLLEVDQPLWIPCNENICVLVTSDDVLHSWAVPSFGIKIDCVPGRLNQVNFNVYRVGTYYGQCSELCGVNHGFMPIEVQAYNWEAFKVRFRLG